MGVLVLHRTIDVAPNQPIDGDHHGISSPGCWPWQDSSGLEVLVQQVEITPARAAVCHVDLNTDPWGCDRALSHEPWRCQPSSHRGTAWTGQRSRMNAVCVA